jgi:hypothetical protein
MCRVRVRVRFPLPSFLIQESRPVLALLCTGLASLALSGLSYNFLVQEQLLLKVVTIGLEYLALIRLKHSEPLTPRPFQVPGGRLGAYTLGLPSLALVAMALAFTPYRVWLLGLAFNLVVVLLYLFLRLLSRLSTNK